MKEQRGYWRAFRHANSASSGAFAPEARRLTGDLTGSTNRPRRCAAYEFDAARVEADLTSLMLTTTAMRLTVPLR